MIKMNIPYDEMPEKIEELMAEVEKLQLENKHLLDLQKSMDKQYEEVEQENRQLKEMQCPFLGTGCKKRRQQLEKVLDEIREYIEREASHYAYEDDWDFYLCEEQIEDLLQILDKAGKE